MSAREIELCYTGAVKPQKERDMASKEIAAGSVVRLKSGGGTTFTVVVVDTAKGAASCFWLAVDGTLCIASIPCSALEVL